jgi:hypothetical protein
MSSSQPLVAIVIINWAATSAVSTLHREKSWRRSLMSPSFSSFFGLTAISSDQSPSSSRQCGHEVHRHHPSQHPTWQSSYLVVSQSHAHSIACSQSFPFPALFPEAHEPSSLMESTLQTSLLRSTKTPFSLSGWCSSTGSQSGMRSWNV